MFEPIWKAVKQELSGERARDFTARIWEHARWNDFQHLGRTAAEVAAIMREIGLQDVQILEFPAAAVANVLVNRHTLLQLDFQMAKVNTRIVLK